jgi:hypothetical protein
MGQQQLLLLVLSTVIVGLATVAGIQAFDENRTQAASDALNQKAAQLAADVKGVYEKPQQFGGLGSDFSSSPPSESEIESKLGIDGTVSVPAAGDGATCDFSNVGQISNGSSSDAITFECTGAGDYTNLTVYGVFENDGDPEVYTQSSDPLGSG